MEKYLTITVNNLYFDDWEGTTTDNYLQARLYSTEELEYLTDVTQKVKERYPYDIVKITELTLDEIDLISERDI